MKPTKFAKGDRVTLNNDAFTIRFIEAMEYMNTPITELEGTRIVVSVRREKSSNSWMVTFELPTEESESWFDERLFQLAEPSASNVSDAVQ